CRRRSCAGCTAASSRSWTRSREADAEFSQRFFSPVGAGLQAGPVRRNLVAYGQTENCSQTENGPACYDPGVPPVVIITGASRGIGAATARLAAENGYAVCVNFRTNEAAAKSVVADI